MSTIITDAGISCTDETVSITDATKRSARGRARLSFMDECPRIGSGWRLVTYHCGSKWVHLSSPTSELTGRVRKDIFQSILRASQRYSCFELVHYS